MAININTFREFVHDIARKNGKGVLPTPEQFNRFTNQALSEFITSMYGNPAEYQPGRPIPRITYEITQAITDRLRFLKEIRNMLVSTDGRVSIPNGVDVKDRNGQVCPDYLHLTLLLGSRFVNDGGTVKEKKVDITIVRDDELSLRLNSELAPPTFEYPIAGIEGDYLQIYPENFQYVRMTYLRQPNTAKWAYTTVNGRPVYDPINSVDLDAPKEAFNMIAMGVLSFMGIYAREADLVGYAEQSKAKGV